MNRGQLDETKFKIKKKKELLGGGRENRGASAL